MEHSDASKTGPKGHKSASAVHTVLHKLGEQCVNHHVAYVVISSGWCELASMSSNEIMGNPKALYHRVPQLRRKCLASSRFATYCLLLLLGTQAHHIDLLMGQT